MAIDANPSSPAMNAYCDVAYADAYFTFRFGSEAWTDFDITQKEALIVTATNLLETWVYGGSKTSSAQPLQWPRQYLYDLNADPIPSATVPSKVMQATCEYAYWVWTEDDRYFSDTDLTQVSKVKVGPLDMTAKASPATIPPKVVSLMNSIGQGVVLSTGSDGTKATSMNMVL